MSEAGPLVVRLAGPRSWAAGVRPRDGVEWRGSGLEGVAAGTDDVAFNHFHLHAMDYLTVQPH